MTNESNTIHITQAQMAQLAAEVNAEVLARRKQRVEQIRAERRAAKIAAWNRRLPRSQR